MFRGGRQKSADAADSVGGKVEQCLGGVPAARAPGALGAEDLSGQVIEAQAKAEWVQEGKQRRAFGPLEDVVELLSRHGRRELRR